MDVNALRSTFQAAREILIAIPGLPSDIYQMHQCVWWHAARAAKPGIRPSFLYRVDDGVVRVRSRDFARGLTREMRSGSASLDIAAVIQAADGHERAVAPSDVEFWAADRLAQAGFAVRRIDLVSYSCQYGIKYVKASGRSLRITLPVARLGLDLEIVDESLAFKAWHEGIGRGRRFGLGMICQ